MPRAARGNERIDDESKDPLYRKKVQCSAERKKMLEKRYATGRPYIKKKIRESHRNRVPPSLTFLTHYAQGTHLPQNIGNPPSQT